MRVARIALAAATAAAIALPGGTALAATSHGAKHTASHPARHSASHRATHATHSASRSTGTKNMTVMESCNHQALIRPGSYMIACGDGSEYLASLHWSTWTSTVATATGRFYLNGCTPSCAKGKWSTSDVLAVLWAATKTHSGQREFMRMTVIYTGKRPAHTAQTFTVSLWYPVVK
jgi:hypothetical protein